MLYWTRHVKTGALLPVFVPVPVGSIVPMNTCARIPPEGCVQSGYELAKEFESELHVQPYSTEPYSPPWTRPGILPPVIMQTETELLTVAQKHVLARKEQGAPLRREKMARSRPAAPILKQLSPLNPRRMCPAASCNSMEPDHTSNPNGMDLRVFPESLSGEPSHMYSVQDSFTANVIFA